MSSILYLGIDPPKGVFHYPVIRTQKIASPELQKALKMPYTHILFTSKNSVRYWPGDLLGKKVIAIGNATAELAKNRGAFCKIAPVAMQEGIIDLLKILDLKKAFILYPRSKLARPILSQFLKGQNISHFAFDLYDTVYQRLKPVPNLANFDEIVFTSPSTVHAFKRIFPIVPSSVKLISIGPITKIALLSYTG